MRYRARKRYLHFDRMFQRPTPAELLDWLHDQRLHDLGDVVRYRVHARPFDGDGTMIAGEWQDGPIPDLGTIARMASDLLQDAHNEVLDVS